MTTSVVLTILAGLARPPLEAAPAAAPTALALPESTANARVFIGPDGTPLPFRDDEALLGFLREARVIEAKEIGEGITNPQRLTLERDGVRARAVFRAVNVEQKAAKMADGWTEYFFRDFYGFEPAAYRLARLVGFDAVPPATLRRLDGRLGSIQIWIEKAMTEKSRVAGKRAPTDLVRWKRQQQMMLIWDALVANSDRNPGNCLYTPDWDLWLIDHTRTFRRSSTLPDTKALIWCEAGFWERLRAVSDDAIRAAVADALNPAEVLGLLERRRKVVALIDGLIRERGEDAVLFRFTR